MVVLELEGLVAQLREQVASEKVLHRLILHRLLLHHLLLNHLIPSPSPLLGLCFPPSALSLTGSVKRS